jgi:hypothetical protein
MKHIKSLNQTLSTISMGAAGDGGTATTSGVGLAQLKDF